MHAHSFPLLMLAVLLAGCAKNADDQVAADAAANTAVIETIEDPDTILTNNQMTDARWPTDDWVGRWAGPEGLFLDIQPSPDGKRGHYALTNQDNLDRQGDYAGVADGATIRFVRDGKNLTIRPGSGKETGFKYLADKQDCLVVISGQEGYCR